MNKIEQVPNGAEFHLGQVVFLKSCPTSCGAVIGIVEGGVVNSFTVLMDGKKQTFYASQLQAEDSSDAREEALSCEDFHAYLSALQIKYPGLSTLYSLNAARVDFIPYQFRPVLRFIRSDRPRLLIADSVGVGKTIEAGLILQELKARREINSVLIICPRPLVTEKKWMNEMKRFEERFTHLDGKTLRYCVQEMHLDGAWPEQYKKTILPYSLLDETLLFGTNTKGKGKRKKGLLNLDPPPRFDLVIVDEAHHIRNEDTFSHKAVRFFCDHAEAAIFLTATPIQLGSNDLFVLLNTLRPDLVIDKESFNYMAEPNPFINAAVSFMRTQKLDWQKQALTALEVAASTSWGKAILKENPNFKGISAMLSGDEIAHEERVKMISDTEAMHSFAGIINRTRRRDIGDFTIRKPETVSIDFTCDQRELHDELLRIQSEIFRQIHGDRNVKFMMTTIKRQAASCFFGLAPFLEDILNRHLDELEWDEVDVFGVPDGDTVETIREQIQTLLLKARSLKPDDPKLDALIKIIRARQKLSNNKIMLFSSFRHTLRYIYDRLKKEGFRIGLVHGGTPDEERVELRERFEKPRESADCLDMLLFSEIGCEGLDYQFCDCMVNYDLPWNPMRVEQRIGRIDRNGQKSESVAIVNLITTGTVDADIYERCLLRIGVFTGALGGSEEILGDISREIRNIAENNEFTEEERREKLQQLSDNKIRLVQEQEKLEKKQAELFGIRLTQEQMNKDVADAASFWLSPDSLRRLIMLYLQRVCGKELEFILGEKPLKTLRLAQEYRDALLKDFQRLPRQNTPDYRRWENWLKGGEPHLSITFDSDCAMQNRDAAFIMPTHPLVKQAALSFDTNQKAVANLSAVSNEIPAGSYEFAVYQWRYHGVREDLTLKPIASEPQVTEQLGRLLENAVDCAEALPSDFSAAARERLDSQHYALWDAERKAHLQKNEEVVMYRRESLTASHNARIFLLEEQLSNATDEKIRKMRRSQITAAEADYERHISELDTAMDRADIIAEPIAYGMIHITGKEL